MNITKSTLILFAALGMISCAKAQIPFPCETFETPAGKTLKVYLVAHGSLAFSYDGYEIQVDPVGKNGTATLDYSAFPKADAILVTHEHFDHLDKKSIAALSKEGTTVLANAKSAEQLADGKDAAYSVSPMANGDERQLTKSIRLRAVPAYNTTPGHLKFHPKGNGNGYILDFDGFIVYVSGDTEVIEEMSQLSKIDVAFLSTNQPYTMTPEQCVVAAKIIQPEILIPYHLGNTKTDAISEGLKDAGIEVRIFEVLR